LKCVLTLGRFAEAIEKREKNHTEGCGHQGVYKQMYGEQGRGMVQQNALSERQDRLVKVEEQKDETETAKRMLGINPRADRRCGIADDRFRDAVHADRIVVAESVLQNTDGSPEKQSRHRIAPADSEIDGHEQRKIDQFGPASVFMQEGLKNEREQASPQDGAAIELVHLDIWLRVRSEIHHVCHFIVEERARVPEFYSQAEPV